jgi:hypothetical protein
MRKTSEKKPLPSTCPARDLNPEPPKFRPGALVTRLRGSDYFSRLGRTALRKYANKTEILFILIFTVVQKLERLCDN